jgi:hypothetical protein
LDYWYLPGFIDYWDLSKLKPPFLAPVLNFIVNAELYIWIALNLIFFGAFFYAFYLFFSKKAFPNRLMLLFLSSSVILLSVIQALVQYGDNWRFGVALKPYIILFMALSFFSFVFKPKKIKQK